MANKKEDEAEETGKGLLFEVGTNYGRFENGEYIDESKDFWKSYRSQVNSIDENTLPQLNNEPLL